MRNLIGQKFGRLTPIKKYSEEHTSKKNETKYRTKYYCKCECYNFTSTSSCGLIQGGSKSCGCLRTDILSLIKSNKIPWRVSFIKQINDYKYSARVKKLAFELTEDECFALFTGNCFYCGIEPQNIINAYTRKDGTLKVPKRKNGSVGLKRDVVSANFISSGIDRVINSKGYIWSNTVSCCTPCNLAKLARGSQEWNIWIKKIAVHQTRQENAALPAEMETY